MEVAELVKIILTEMNNYNTVVVNVQGDIRDEVYKQVVKEVYNVEECTEDLLLLAREYLRKVNIGIPLNIPEGSLIITDNAFKFKEWKKANVLDLKSGVLIANLRI